MNHITSLHVLETAGPKWRKSQGNASGFVHLWLMKTKLKDGWEWRWIGDLTSKPLTKEMNNFLMHINLEGGPTRLKVR